MTRKTDVRRNSRPVGPELFKSTDEKTTFEARNGLVQFDEVRRLIGASLADKNFKLRPPTKVSGTIEGVKRIWRRARHHKEMRIE